MDHMVADRIQGGHSHLGIDSGRRYPTGVVPDAAEPGTVGVLAAEGKLLSPDQCWVCRVYSLDHWSDLPAPK